MKKTPTLFKRDFNSREKLVIDELTEGSEWVINGEGVATQKLDGTCCFIKDGILFKRREVKRGGVLPEGFIPAQEPDKITGDYVGWIKVGASNEDEYFREAFALKAPNEWHNGTYELLGEKINKDMEHIGRPHLLWKHSEALIICNVPTNFVALKEWIGRKNLDIEGVVWHHPDGRMVKIKKRDFGFKR